MKKALKIAVIVLVAAFIILQLFRPEFSNPPVNPEERLEAATNVPEKVRAILKRSCADCHSNETEYPWYSKIQPSGWFLSDHIETGRQELNLSVWKTYEPRRQRRKLSEICEQVQAREMPLPSYLWIHRDAVLSDDDIKTLCDWTEAESAAIAEPK